MAAVTRHIKLAQSLPPQLLRFFTRFPPASVAVAGAQAQPTTPELSTTAATSGPISSELSASPNTAEPAIDPATIPTAKKSHPFLPWRNPRTGMWHAPHYSLRRQAQLFKLAVEHDVLPLMPESPKHPEVRAQRRLEFGLRVQGTGEGRRVKGKAWERSLNSRLEERRKALENMPALILEWKRRRNGKFWKKFPR